MPNLKNYTTTVATSRTIGEIQELLAAQGAQQITTIYTAGKPSGLGFTLQTAVGRQSYQLPVDVAAVFRVMSQERRVTRGTRGAPPVTLLAQAERVGWRIVKDWVAAQLSLIRVEMATMDQVMLPYMLLEGGTVYQAFAKRGLELA